jgi:predicted Zn-dependent peptidase
MYAFDLPDNHYATYLQRLAAITGEDVLRVARRWLDTDSFAVVVAGDAGLLRVKLEQMRLGEVLLYEDA